MAKASRTSKTTKSPTANRNYSANLADGRNVRVRDGVKTYSDKPLQVKGKGGISISGQSYSRDRGGTGFAPITPESLNAPPPPPTIPPPAVTNPGPIVDTNNAALAPGLAAMGITYDAKNGFGYSTPAQGTQPSTGSSLQDLQQQRMQMLAGVEAPNYESLYNRAYRDSGKRDAERDVNTYTAQINSIVANRDANMLRLEGQGRGIPDVIIGGQQAQIQKEAAIAALPVQAQLAAAQGRLDQASEYLNTMFTIKKADADAKYNRSLKIIDTYFDYADKAEQRQFEELKLKKAQDYEQQQNLLNTQNQLMQMILANGGPKSVQDAVLASKDTTSAIQAAGVYGTDMLSTQLKREQIAAAQRSNQPGPAKRDTQVVDGKLVDMQTGEVITDLNQTSGAASDSAAQITFLRDTVSRIVGDKDKGYEELYKGAGPGKALEFVKQQIKGDTRYTRLESQVDTLRANMLTLATDPTIKQFFGPQMSDADVRLMTAAGTTLRPGSQSPEELKAEALRIDDLLNRMQTAVTNQGGSGVTFGVNLITAPDGQLIEIID